MGIFPFIFFDQVLSGLQQGKPGGGKKSKKTADQTVRQNALAGPSNSKATLTEALLAPNQPPAAVETDSSSQPPVPRLIRPTSRPTSRPTTGTPSWSDSTPPPDSTNDSDPDVGNDDPTATALTELGLESSAPLAETDALLASITRLIGSQAHELQRLSDVQESLRENHRTLVELAVQLREMVEKSRDPLPR